MAPTDNEPGGSEDHLAKECDQPRNPATIQCRNCDEFGHTSRDCTAPKDWSKVKCNNCGEMGHTGKSSRPSEKGNICEPEQSPIHNRPCTDVINPVKRCKQAIKEDENAGGVTGFGGDTADFSGDAGGISSAGNDWENNTADAGNAFGGGAPVAAPGGGW